MARAEAASTALDLLLPLRKLLALLSGEGFFGLGQGLAIERKRRQKRCVCLCEGRHLLILEGCNQLLLFRPKTPWPLTGSAPERANVGPAWR